MPRPRKETSELFYDQFASWPVDEQGIALRILTELYRQAQKIAKRNGKPEDDDYPLLENPK